VLEEALVYIRWMNSLYVIPQLHRSQSIYSISDENADRERGGPRTRTAMTSFGK